MNNFEKLLKNIQMFIDSAGEEYLLSCYNLAQDYGETIETIEDLNDLLEEEMSNWEE